MLFLLRRVGESIVIGTDVIVSVSSLSRNRACLAIEAPPETRVDRREIWLAKTLRRVTGYGTTKETAARPGERDRWSVGDDTRGGESSGPSPRTCSKLLGNGKTAFEAYEDEHRQADGQHSATASAGQPREGDGDEEATLHTALARLVAIHHADGGPEIEFCDDLSGDDPGGELRMAVVVTVQELLQNACRHSHSRSVLLGISQDDRHICVQVQDWGVGFDTEAVEPHQRGLRRVVQLTRALGGFAEVDTRLGAGTCVVVEFPLEGKKA